MAALALRPARLVYAFDEATGIWSCAYLGLTGHGETPEAARESLLVISRVMAHPWNQAPIQ